MTRRNAITGEDQYGADLPLLEFRDREFRLNPAYHVVAHQDMPPAQRASLKSLAADPDYYGLLLAEGSPRLGIIAIDQEGASFFTRLHHAGPLPGQLKDPQEIAAFVLDGILEMKVDGRFTCGPPAAKHLLKQLPPSNNPANHIAELSFSAIKLAQQLPSSEPKTVSSFLYNYNFLPLNPIRARRFSSQEAINSALGLQNGGAVTRILQEDYLTADLPGWRCWQSVTNELVVEAGEPTYKLYISPHPAALGELFPFIARCLAENDVPSFKLGREAVGLLRADKMVAYFTNQAELLDLAHQLAEILEGYPAQGVPFTAAITGDGMLSWGMDPPENVMFTGWRDSASWRAWISNRLARSILHAQTLGTGDMDPDQFALLRLRFDGVNPHTWLPADSLWN